ncbi:hypothetical protein Tco_1049178 [Tanacetum coccineum]
MSFTMKMEILLEPTSNKLQSVDNSTGSTLIGAICFETSPIREHVKYEESNSICVRKIQLLRWKSCQKILRKLNLSDHRCVDKVLKLKKFQERCNIKAFQEWYEHVGPEVASPQDGKVTRWRRDCAWLMISRCSRSQCQIQVQGTSSIQEVNDHYNIFTRESQEYELKTKDKA